MRKNRKRNLAALSLSVVITGYCFSGMIAMAGELNEIFSSQEIQADNQEQIPEEEIEGTDEADVVTESHEPDVENGESIEGNAGAGTMPEETEISESGGIQESEPGEKNQDIGEEESRETILDNEIKKENNDGNTASVEDGENGEPDAEEGSQESEVNEELDQNGSLTENKGELSESVEDGEEISDIDTEISGSLEPEMGMENSTLGEMPLTDAIADDLDEESVGLQMPESIRMTIDQWESEGRGQIFSDQHVIRNVGEAPIKLVFTETVIPQANGVIVHTDTEGIHDGIEKSIYVEMVFGNGDKVVLTQEGTVYETVLEAGAELSLFFTGEVNENTCEQWEGSDITVGITYTWTVGKIDEELNDIDSMVGNIAEMPDAVNSEDKTEGSSDSEKLKEDLSGLVKRFLKIRDAMRCFQKL